MRTNLFLCGLACAMSVTTAAFAADQDASAITRSPAAAGDGVAVGVAKRDGVTVSGNEAFVTRNGVTEKLAKELRLPSGIVVRPDGSVRISDNRETNLQADQLLTFDGHIVTIPNDPNVNPALPQVTAPPAAQTSEIAPNAAERSLYSNARTSSGSQGSVFLSSGGFPFIGTVTAPGVITTSDGTTVPIDGNVRAVTFGPGNVASVGTLNANGTILTQDGSTIFPDGTVRNASGVVTSRAGTGQGAAVSPAMREAATAAAQGNETQRSIANQQRTTNQQGTSNQQGATNQQNANGNVQGTNANQGQTTGGASTASPTGNATSRGSATGASSSSTGAATGGGAAAGGGRGGGGAR